MSGILQIGDVVEVHGRRARVTAIELVAAGETDGGIPVNAAPWSAADSLVVDLDNGRWVFGDQLEAVRS
jgi:hypothetical protein